MRRAWNHNRTTTTRTNFILFSNHLHHSRNNFIPTTTTISSLETCPIRYFSHSLLSRHFENGSKKFRGKGNQRGPSTANNTNNNNKFRSPSSPSSLTNNNNNNNRKSQQDNNNNSSSASSSSSSPSQQQQHKKQPPFAKLVEILVNAPPAPRKISKATAKINELANQRSKNPTKPLSSFASNSAPFVAFGTPSPSSSSSSTPKSTTPPTTPTTSTTTSKPPTAAQLEKLSRDEFYDHIIGLASMITPLNQREKNSTVSSSSTMTSSSSPVTTTSMLKQSMSDIMSGKMSDSSTSSSSSGRTTLVRNTPGSLSSTASASMNNSDLRSMSSMMANRSNSRTPPVATAGGVTTSTTTTTTTTGMSSAALHNKAIADMKNRANDMVRLVNQHTATTAAAAASDRFGSLGSKSATVNHRSSVSGATGKSVNQRNQPGVGNHRGNNTEEDELDLDHGLLDGSSSSQQGFSSADVLVKRAIKVMIKNSEKVMKQMYPIRLNDITPISIDKGATIILDDAIALNSKGELLSLIADPSAFIDKKTPLWVFAKQRLQSLYLDDMETSWMLPLEAAQFLSLSDTKMNYCMVVNLSTGDMFRAVAPPVRRLTFSQADAVIRSKKKDNRTTAALLNMYEKFPLANSIDDTVSASTAMLRYFMIRTNTIATRFITTNKLKRYVVWNEMEQSVKISSPLRRFSDWIAQEVILKYLDQKAKDNKSLPKTKLSSLENEKSWFTSPYNSQEIFHIQTEFTAYLGYSEEIGEGKEDNQRIIQALERRGSDKVIARIVDVDPQLSTVELQISPSQLYTTKLHLVSLEEAMYIQTLHDYKPSTLGSSVNLEKVRKSGDLVPGAYVQLRIRAAESRTGVIALSHVWDTECFVLSEK